MARIKGGVTTRRRHTRLLKRAKGYRHGRKRLYRLAKQAWLKAGQHAYRDRRRKKREFRAQWIIIINAAARQHGVSYRELMADLGKREVKLNRKVLSELAEHYPEEFTRLISGASRAATSVSSQRPSRK